MNQVRTEITDERSFLMNAVKFKTGLFALPTTQLILGTWYNDKPNYMALAWATRVNFKPPLIAMGVNKGHASHEAILKEEQFSLCMPSPDMVEITDYVGIVSGRKIDKSDLFKPYYGELEHAPMIREAPLNLALKLHTTVDLPTNTVFIGEVIESWCEESFLVNGKPDMTKVEPFILTMADNHYWRLGEQVGNAWKAGAALKKRLGDTKSIDE